MMTAVILQDTKSLKISRSPQMAQKHLSNTIQAKSIKVRA